MMEQPSAGPAQLARHGRRGNHGPRRPSRRSPVPRYSFSCEESVSAVSAASTVGAFSTATFGLRGRRVFGFASATTGGVFAATDDWITGSSASSTTGATAARRPRDAGLVTAALRVAAEARTGVRPAAGLRAVAVLRVAAAVLRGLVAVFRAVAVVFAAARLVAGAALRVAAAVRAAGLRAVVVFAAAVRRPAAVVFAAVAGLRVAVAVLRAVAVVFAAARLAAGAALRVAAAVRAAGLRAVAVFTAAVRRPGGGRLCRGGGLARGGRLFRRRAHRSLHSLGHGSGGLGRSLRHWLAPGSRFRRLGCRRSASPRRRPARSSAHGHGTRAWGGTRLPLVVVTHSITPSVSLSLISFTGRSFIPPPSLASLDRAACIAPATRPNRPNPPRQTTILRNSFPRFFFPMEGPKGFASCRCGYHRIVATSPPRRPCNPRDSRRRSVFSLSQVSNQTVKKKGVVLAPDHAYYLGWTAGRQPRAPAECVDPIRGNPQSCCVQQLFFRYSCAAYRCRRPAAVTRGARRAEQPSETAGRCNEAATPSGIEYQGTASRFGQRARPRCFLCTSNFSRIAAVPGADRGGSITAPEFVKLAYDPTANRYGRTCHADSQQCRFAAIEPCADPASRTGYSEWRIAERFTADDRGGSLAGCSRS